MTKLSNHSWYNPTELWEHREFCQHDQELQKKSTANPILNGERQTNAFSLSWKQGKYVYSQQSVSLNIVLEVLHCAVRQEKEIQGNKGRNYYSSIVVDMIV